MKLNVLAAVVVLVVTLLIPILDVLGIINIAQIGNMGLGEFGFVWAAALVLSIGELLMLAARRVHA